MPIFSARVNLNKRHTPAQRAARQDAAMAALNRIYCDAVGAWRHCATKSCKRHRRCCGDAWPCLQRALPHVPRGRFSQILAAVRDGGPRHVPPVNRVEEDMRKHPPGWLR